MLRRKFVADIGFPVVFRFQQDAAAADDAPVVVWKSDPELELFAAGFMPVGLRTSG